VTLEKAGLPKDYVQFVKLMPIDAAAALPQGSIDAFPVGNPTFRNSRYSPARARSSLLGG
jgi:hypothetical protein